MDLEKELCDVKDAFWKEVGSCFNIDMSSPQDTKPIQPSVPPPVGGLHPVAITDSSHPTAKAATSQPPDRTAASAAGKPTDKPGTKPAEKAKAADQTHGKSDKPVHHELSHGQKVETKRGEATYTSKDGKVHAKVTKHSELVSRGDDSVSVNKQNHDVRYHNSRDGRDVHRQPDGTVVAKHGDGSTVSSNGKGIVTERDNQGRTTAEHCHDHDIHYMGRKGNVYGVLVTNGETVRHEAQEMAEKHHDKTIVLGDAHGNTAIVTKNGDIIVHNKGDKGSTLLVSDGHGGYIEHKLDYGSQAEQAETRKILEARGYKFDEHGKLRIDNEVTYNLDSGGAATQDQDNRAVTVSADTARPGVTIHTTGGPTTSYQNDHTIVTRDNAGHVQSTYDAHTEKYSDYDYTLDRKAVRDQASGVAIGYDGSVNWKGVVEIAANFAMKFVDGTYFSALGRIFDNGKLVGDICDDNSSSSVNGSRKASEEQSDVSEDSADADAAIQSVQSGNITDGTLEYLASLSSDISDDMLEVSAVPASARDALLVKLRQAQANVSEAEQRAKEKYSWEQAYGLPISSKIYDFDAGMKNLASA